MIIITGANRGLGKEAARQLASLGARLIFGDTSSKRSADDRSVSLSHSGCRDDQAAKETASEVAKACPEAPLITIHKLDLNSIESVNYFAQIILDTERNIDCLINNAGLIATTKRTTVDGRSRRLRATVA